ncbi:MAG: lysoplasmalogenase family protein, partial [Acidimicrobiia bacterium]|nr:lysoplasmalogenase family protein [Acidimicrobiia bacterium]
MVGPVVAYVVIISAMVATAVGATSAGAPGLVVVGAIAFFISDLAVARDRFVAPGFGNRVWGLPLYYLGQILLAGSIA